MPYKNPPPCQICSKPSVARKLCGLHYERWKTHGDPTITLRPDDWGRRSRHPHWERWKQTTGSKSPQGRCARWDDFWVFVEDIGPRPGKAMLVKVDAKAPWGPENFYWKEPVQSKSFLADKAAYQRNWRAQNLARTKGYELKRKFGITFDDYHSMLEGQGGGCAICGEKDPYFKHMAVDHCHETGSVRGILCCACNRALGGFKDNIQILQRAISYLGSR